jgi:putative thioredoxin
MNGTLEKSPKGKHYSPPEHHSGKPMKDASPYIFDIDGKDEFQQQVIDASHQQPVLVDFWADWCSPCLMIAPVLAKVIPEYEGKVLLAKMDADENMKLAGHYKLRGFPTIIMFINGEEVGRFGGAKPAPEVRKFIDQHLPT